MWEKCILCTTRAFLSYFWLKLTSDVGFDVELNNCADVVVFLTQIDIWFWFWCGINPGHDGKELLLKTECIVWRTKISCPTSIFVMVITKFVVLLLYWCWHGSKKVVAFVLCERSVSCVQLELFCRISDTNWHLMLVLMWN